LRKNRFQVSFFHPLVSIFLDLILSPPPHLDAIALASHLAHLTYLY
jgi:hypothetical protein